MNAVEDYEKEPFLTLEKSLKETLDQESLLTSKHAHPRTYSWKFTALMHIIVSGLLTIGIVSLTKTFEGLSTGPSKYTWFSPAQEGAFYSVYTPSLDYWTDKSWVEPSYESDYAWNDLMANQTVRLTNEEVSALNITDLNLTLLNDGGYVSILGVFHNLHCIRRIRQSLYLDYYYANVTEEQKAIDMEHATHCLEVLRTSLMCHADLAVYPLVRGGGKDHPLLAVPNVPQRCINWDMLMSWAYSRHFTVKDIKE